MLNPHRPISQNKNQHQNRYGPQLITELHQQQIAFKSFLSSLDKCPNRFLPFNMNPQQQNSKQFSYSMPHKQFKSSQFTEKHLLNSKISTIQKIKNTEDAPLTNFRITKLKSNDKSLLFDPFQSKTSRINKSINKSQIKTDIKKISNFQQFPSSFSKNKSVNSKDILFQKSTQILQQKSENLKKSQNLIESNVKNLQLQKTSCLSWDPNSKQFLSSFFSSSKQIHQTNFLLSLLNLNIQNTINFLIQDRDIICNINEVETKTICNFFQQILKINQIKTLQEPLIKKYSNCIFYGEKPNFVSAHSGIILYFNGNSYFGSLLNFQKHGFGIELAMKSQNIKDKISDKRFSSKRDFQKSYSNQKKLQQTQKFIVYQGDFINNSKTGLFRVSGPKYVYEGSLCKGLFEGQGTLITEKSTFKGKWEKNKKLNGLQIFILDQMTYQGEYFEDKFHGFGQLRKKDQFYEGQFQQSYKNGKGILVNRQFIFEGTFKYNKKHGKGTFFDKNQYNLKNNGRNEEDYEFNECVYRVQFYDDKMIDKVQIRGNNCQQDDLQSFGEDKSQKSTLTFDVQNIRPSKLLNKGKTDRLYQRQQNSRETFQNFQRYRRVLQVIPSEPQQQIQFTKKVNSYLEGNHSYRSPRKMV